MVETISWISWLKLLIEHFIVYLFLINKSFSYTCLATVGHTRTWISIFSCIEDICKIETSFEDKITWDADVVIGLTETFSTIALWQLMRNKQRIRGKSMIICYTK